jgi:hypothetical protein
MKRFLKKKKNKGCPLATVPKHFYSRIGIILAKRKEKRAINKSYYAAVVTTR